MDKQVFYLMIVNHKHWWFDLRGAGVIYDSLGWVPVEIGGLVIEVEGRKCTERPITDQERQQIVSIADEYSGNK